ncbi:hypothetical protein ABPG75_011922 [Micractinium tetrahymenae]
MASQVEAIKWVPGTAFIVDGFRFPSPAATAYFLTHAHSDHTTGLTSSWDAGPIYCSPITARILRHDFNIRPNRLRILELDRPVMIGGVEVTLIDANHCPGAVMLLFKIPTPGAASMAAGGSATDGKPAPQLTPAKRPATDAAGTAAGAAAAATAAWAAPAAAACSHTTVLHTGDFRWQPGMARHPSLAGRRIDCLMLDTTYCQPKWRFPPQAEAVALMVREMRREAAQDPGTLFVIGSYHIGKERAYLGAAHQLGWRVHCAPAKRRLLRLLGLPPEWLALLTDAAEEAQVHVLGMGEQLHEPALADRIAGTRWSRVVAIKPTGWSFRPRGGLERRESGSVITLGIPYSEHSSWDDLRACVAALRPRRLIPTVDAGDAAKRRAIVDRFADLMDLSGDRSRIPGYFFKKAAAEGLAPGGQAQEGQALGTPQAEAQAQQQQQQGEGAAGTLQQRPPAAQQDGAAPQQGGSVRCGQTCSVEDCGSGGRGALGPVAVAGASAATGCSDGCSDSSGGGALAGSAVEGCSTVADGSIAGKVQEAQRPPPAPRLDGPPGPVGRLGSGGGVAAAAVAAPGGEAAATAAGAGSGGAAPLSGPVSSAQGSLAGAEEAVDLSAVDVAEQHRILRFIQSQAAARAGRGQGSGASIGKGTSSNNKAGRKRPSDGGRGLCQPSLKRFFSPSQDS